MYVKTLIGLAESIYKVAHCLRKGLGLEVDQQRVILHAASTLNSGTVL